MLPLKTILYLVLLSSGIIGSMTYHPLLGIIGYIFTYNISPAGEWWGLALFNWGINYSFLFAVATGIGIIVRRSQLRFIKIFESQEIVLIMFLAIIWLSIPFGIGFNQVDSVSIKMTKVAIMLLMASHIITDIKRYEIMIWTLILASLYLGYKVYNAPDWMFYEGRFNVGVGGSDFNEGNFLGAHFAMLLPFIGIIFLKGSWKSKVICLISGVFVVNGITLCRSRGMFLAVLAGIIPAILFAIPTKRIKICLWLSLAIIGTFSLTDSAFWGRMETISIDSHEMDTSSSGRILIWKEALHMVSDNPLGVGEGNFKRCIGEYNPKMLGDIHNTFLRCLTELGVQGAFVLVILISNAFRILFRLKKDIEPLPNREDFLWHIYALKIALVSYLVAGMFISLTYIEDFYWLLMFPVFLKRSVENEKDALQNTQTKVNK